MGVSFTPDAAQRISNVVRTVEKTPTDLTGKKRGNQGVPASQVCIYITSNTGTAIYQGSIQNGFATDVDDTGITHTGATVIVLNRIELGSTASSPFLDNGDYVPGWFKGIDAESSLPIYWTWIQYGEACGS